jgi:hypothetical protein
MLFPWLNDCDGALFLQCGPNELLYLRFGSVRRDSDRGAQEFTGLTKPGTSDGQIRIFFGTFTAFEYFAQGGLDGDAICASASVCKFATFWRVFPTARLPR